MSVEALLSELDRRRVRIAVDNGALVVKAPRGVMSPDLAAWIRQHKAALIEIGGTGRTDDNGAGNIAAPAFTPAAPALAPLSPQQFDLVAARVPGGAVAIQDIYPLAPLQAGILFHHLLQPHGDTYLMPTLLAVDSRERLQRLEGAIGRAVARHDILRSAVQWEALDEPVQVVWRRAPFNIELLDFDPAVADIETQLRAHTDPRHFRIDIRRPPLLRGFAAFDAARGRWLLQLLHHHLIMDHTTLELLFAEVGLILQGREAELPAPLPFRDFVAHTRGAARRNEDEDFFRRQLADVDAATQPFGLADEWRGTVASARLSVDADLAGQIRRQARQRQVSAAAIFHLAFAQVLARASGRDDVLFGTVLMGRLQGGVGADRAFGLFINTLPLRLRFAERDVAGCLRETQAQLIELLQHEHASLALARRCSALPAGTPLFCALLNYRYTQPALQPGDRLLDGVELLAADEFTSYPLTLSVDDMGEGFQLTTLAPESIGAPRFCRFMHAALAQLVGALAQAETIPVRQLDLLPAAERQRVLHHFNDTARPFPADVPIHRLFEQQAQQRPDTIAVACGDERLTYRELNARANRLARVLLGHGVHAGDRVATLLERSAELVIAQLAILKCGAAYLPLDSQAPLSRQRFMLKEGEVRLLIARRGGVAPASAPRLDLDDIDLREGESSNPPAVSSGQSCAYVMYTSGSSGQPKGVMVAHRGIARLAIANGFAEFSPATHMAFAASPAFDASTLEVWAPLLNGGRLVIISQETLLDPPALIERLSTAGVNTLWLTVGLFNQLADALTPVWSRLELLLIGGDTPDPATVARVQRRAPALRIINGYGPTETTVFAATHAIPPLGENCHGIPIGRPVANTHIYLLDGHRQPVPIGATGEIHIGGAGVALGYINRPQLTAERFIRDPFSDDADARLYRSGDLGRWREDGVIEYLGRNDFQVKIRGFRIELGEIETQLMQLPGVEQAAVLAREDAPGQKQLVAYLVGAGAEAPGGPDSAGVLDPAALRQALASTLPDYMVPSAFVQLPGLPLTPNGKLDRRALPAPAGDAFVRSAYEPPQGDVEQALADIWCRLLGRERIGRDDSFFALGGHSLLAVQLVSQLRQRLGIELPLNAVFAHPVLRELANAAAQAGCSDAEPIPLADRSQPLPLSWAQQRLWFIARLDAHASAAYHIAGGLQLRGAIDETALRAALDQLLRRHEILRSRFVLRDGQPTQWIDPPREFALMVSVPDSGDLAEQIRLEAETPFDHGDGPLLRARLLAVAPDHHILLLTLHHLIADGWSMGILIRELSELYSAFIEGRPDPLPPLPLQYADYAVWQRQWLQGAALQMQLQYWVDHLRGAPEQVSLPMDRPRPNVQDYRGETIDVELDADLTRALKKLSQRHGTTLYMTLLSAWAATVSRLSGQEEVVIGSPVAGRPRAELEGLIGLFVNTQALRIDLSSEPTVAELLTQVRDIALAAQQHQDIPFEQVVEALNPTRSLAHSPLFQLMFAWQNTPEATPALGDLDVEPLATPYRSAQFDLTLDLREENETIRGSLTFATALFDRATIERHWRCLHAMLCGMVTASEGAVTAIELLDAGERQKIIQDFNKTDKAYPPPAAIHELFQRQVRQRPGADALAFAGQMFSYAELNARANRLAHYLIEAGVGPDARVAICLRRSVEMIVALLATLKAGGAYVPLDPTYPPERLGYMLADSAPLVVLADEQGRRAMPERALDGLRLFDPKDDTPIWADRSAENPLIVTSPGQLAYVIYTSGSTGAPKGVMVEHRSVCNLLRAQRELFTLGADSRVLQFASFSFDASVLEILMALCHGSCLCLPEGDGVLVGGQLALQLRQLRITHAVLPPVVLAQADPRDFGSVTTLIVGGEALGATLAKRWAKDRCLINVYGPTETTVCTTSHRCADDSGAPPIGRPLANTRIYLLDARCQPVPIGAVGEIHIGGAGVARGYLNRPELTAERFIRDPFSDDADARLYRSGDLGRWREDGVIEYLGRNDFQVKIRGFRIELGEIETQLMQLPGVEQAAVLAREDAPGQKQLVAYLVGADAKQDTADALDPAALRRALASSLPDYMVPSAFVQLPELPLTPNGKLDRRALPAPAGDAFARSAYEPPQGDIEETLADIWSALLGRELIGRDDSFFALGGHSLLAVQLVSQLRQRLGIELPLSAVFAHPVLRELAAAAAQAACSDAEPIPTADRSQPLPLSWAQQRLWFIARLDARASAAYHIPGGLHLRGELHRLALQAALNRLIQRHEILRTHFVMRDGQPGQQIDASPDIVLAVEEADDAVLEQWQRTEATTPFDLTHGPLLRVRLLRLAPDHHVLLLTLHHLVADGWSVGLLVRELSELYSAFMEGRPDPLPPLPLQYADYAVWQRQWLQGAALQTQLQYWVDHLRGAPEQVSLPMDRPRPNVQDYHGETIDVELDADLTRALKKLSQRHGTTLYMTLLSAWAATVSRLSGQEEVVIGSPVAGRPRAELESLIGLFVNTQALRIDLSSEPTVAELLAQVRDIALAAQQHQDVPFEQVVEALNPTRSLAHGPLFQLMFAWQNTPEATPALGDLDVEPMATPYRSAQFDLTLDLREENDTIRGSLTFATALFDRATIERHWRCLHAMLRGMVTASDGAVTAIELLEAEERRRVIHGFNDTAAAFPQVLLHQLFEARAEQCAAAPALAFAGGEVTYGELNARANRLAHHLIEVGVGPDARVAICLPRGVEMIVALLATLKAGGAYVPLDPAYPPERLAYMLRDSGPLALITTQPARARLGAAVDGLAVNTIAMDAEAAAWSRASTQNPSPAAQGVSPSHLAYVIYTSGSTGAPKGVMVEHRSVCNLALAQAGLFGLNGDSRVLQFASFSFDACVWEIVMALCHGACLCLPPGALLAGDVLATALREWRVSHALLPPVVLAELDPDGLPALTTLVVGGEAVSAALARRWARGRRFINAYGPTEATVYASLHGCSAAETAAPAIGRPIANARIHLLDKHRQPVPVGVAGEIHIGGAGVARGYLDRPGLTAERFIPDPFSDEPEARLYRSGDLGRWREDGTLEYLGRNDFQIKLRGFRIEPGEIEAQLNRLPGVAQSAVLARQPASGAKQLVAYVVASAGAVVEPTGLRRSLAATLPEYMLPAAFVVLPALPLTANGKLDRRALPAPAADAVAAGVYEAPQGPVEEMLARIWGELLKREGIGRHDQFFALGGHSLLLLEMTAHLARRGIELPPGEVFAYPVLAELAAHIRQRQSAPEPDAAIAIRAGAGTPLFLVHEYSGLDLYFAPLAARIDPGIPVHGLPGVPLGRRQPDSMPALARRLLRLVRAAQPEGPYRIAGWSFGGALAYELCLQLHAEGEEIAFAGLLDSWHPAALAAHLRERLRDGPAQRLLAICADAVDTDRARVEGLRQGAVAMPFDTLFARCGELGLLPGYLAGRDSRQVQRYIERLAAHDRALAHYRPAAAAFAVHLFVAGEAAAAGVERPGDGCLGWSRCVPAAQRRLVPVSGGHQSIMERHIGELGRAISAALRS